MPLNKKAIQLCNLSAERTSLCVLRCKPLQKGITFALMYRFLNKLRKHLRYASTSSSSSFIKKYFSLPKGILQYPADAHLLLPWRLKASSIDILENNKARINIWYRENFSGYVNPTMHMQYDVIRKGSILCEGVFQIERNLPVAAGKLEKTYFPFKLSIQCPLKEKENLQISCKKMIIESIGTYVVVARGLVRHEDFLERMQLLKG